MSRTLSTDDLFAYLKQRAETPVDEASVMAYEDAAAVLSSIEHPAQLQPAGPAEPDAAERVLGSSLIPATGRRFEGTVMLDPAVRATALERLLKAGRVEAALAANPDERKGKGLIQEQLEQYLMGEAKPLDEQSAEELDATHQVVVWLAGVLPDVLPDVPTEGAVERRAAYRRLLAPFEAIAGDDLFRGRKKELDDLREYIGVLAPQSLLRRIRSKAFRWPQEKPRAALSLHGPGGVGKSALVARFMLEHARLPEEARIPFAYLDFDRSNLDVADPLGLTIEMLKQLDAQFTGDRFAALRVQAEAQWQEVMQSDEREHVAAAGTMLADVLGMLEGMLGPRPYVVVLDTFEEVQYRGEAKAFPLWELLARLQLSRPFLRVVVAGRAPVSTLRLAGAPPNPMELGQLDPDSAVAVLQSQGVPDAKVARDLVRQYGAVPLTLKLVASLYAKDPDALRAPVGSDRGLFFVRAGDEVIQGQLFERILSHVRNPRVQRLAHPGLVLRRITPELIQVVLDEPCQLGVTGPDDAQALFGELHRETSLVSVDEADGSLVHRSDLRRVMLKLLLSSEPARVEDIRRRAIAYYDAQSSQRAVAERTYHRLHLREPVPDDTLKLPEVRGSIQTAMTEFPIDVQQHLAGLGFHVSEEVLAQASQEQQDEASASLVEEYLAYGPTTLAEAKRILAPVRPEMDRASPLFRAAARVAIQARDDTTAATWIGRGLEEATRAGATLLTVRLLQEQAWLEALHDGRPSGPTLDALGQHAARQNDVQAILQHRLYGFDPATADPGPMLQALGGLIGSVTPADVWACVPVLRQPVSATLQQAEAPFLEALVAQVFGSDSPFRSAGLPDSAAQIALDRVLRIRRPGPDFGKEFLGLLDAWPYRILAVEPAYGRSGDELAESSA